MQQIRIDFDNPGLPQSLGAVEGESQSRIFQAALYKSGAAYTAPAGAVYSIMYCGFGPQNQGWYDTIEDGAGKRAACTVSGNIVTCELARQALRVPGHLTVVLCVTDAKGYMLKSWPIMADVRNDGYEDTGESEMYFNLSGIAGNYLTQLEKAMTDAETTRNNLISTSAQAKKDIDAKAAETLKSIPESYTELDGSVKNLREELDNTNGVLNIDVGIGTNQSVPDFNLVKIIEKDVKANNTYIFTVTLSSAPTSSTYIYIKEKGTILQNFQVQGLTTVTYGRKFNTDSKVSVEISSENYTGTATAKIQSTATNEIEAIKTAVFQQTSLTARPINELYELVQGAPDNFDILPVKYMVTTKNVIYFPDDVILTVFNGFRVGVYTYDAVNPTTFEWSTWKYDKLIVKRGFARIVVRRADESTSEMADINEFGSKVLVEYKKIRDISPDKNTQFYSLLNGKKYFSHIDVDYYDGLIIPSQSIFDIRRAKRLGFNAIELNARKTSDGVFYAFHGHQNCFGNAFHSVDNSDISNVNVSTVTSEYIQNNIRYNSKYEKYRTAPTTLEDALIECKINNIVPVVEISDGNVNLVKSIMGENNYVFGIYDKDRTNELKNCVVSGWLTGTADEMIEKANTSGQPYICAINVADSMYKNYGDEDWKKFTKKIHEAGYFVSCSYQTPAVGEKLLKAGIDIMASKGEINDFSYGNLFDAESEMNFSEFTSDGNVLDGVLNLTAGQTVKPTGIDDTVFLGGSSLHIIFSGKIHIQMGIVDNYFESDGSNEIWLSSFYQENVPTFKITAITETNIFELSYKASKM